MAIGARLPRLGSTASLGSVERVRSVIVEEQVESITVLTVSRGPLRTATAGGVRPEVPSAPRCWHDDARRQGALMDLQAIKARSKAVWGTGDYAPTGRQLEPVSEVLVESLGVGRDHRVLDVAAGHGNCALAAARRGAEVVASDFSPVMLERGRARTEASGLDIAWREADAADLPFDDGEFDRITSVFGAIFAPEQRAVAAELARVTRPGGLIGLTAWTADGLIARMLRIPSGYGPPPPEGAPDPMRWGDPAHVAELFAGTGCALTVTPRTMTFSYPSWDAWRRDLEAHGMLVELKRSTPEDDYEDLLERMRAFLSAHEHAGRPGVAYDAEYLEIQAQVAG